ncbi:hypothetical protein TNCV_153311 [Trichonephila clavipes]|nr:hypothetical protein TNCV_153311 [Trichonephila clavipes]
MPNSPSQMIPDMLDWRYGMSRKFSETARNEVTSTADQDYKWTGTSSKIWGHETVPLRVKGNVEDLSSELDSGD